MHNFIEEVVDISSINDLMKGYVLDEKNRVYTCLFCGEMFHMDLIYKSMDGANLINGRRGVEEHILREHGGSFKFLINLDKSLTGLTDRQKEIFEILFAEKDNRIISEKMNTTPATVRSYKYKKRERTRQSKVFLAISYLINESYNDSKKLEPEEITSRAIDNIELPESLDDLFEKNPSNREKIEIINNILGKKNLDFL